MPGGSYRVSVGLPGFVHRSFIDTKLLRSIDDTAAVRTNVEYLGIVRTYTRAFFDRYLNDAPGELLTPAGDSTALLRVESFPGTGTKRQKSAVGTSDASDAGNRTPVFQYSANPSSGKQYNHRSPGSAEATTG